MRRICKFTSLLGWSWAGVCAAQALPPRYDHVVIVVEENHTAAGIIGNADAPYMNSLVAAGASFDNMHGLTHPSQPNYLNLFSGSAQGWTTDGVPLNPQGDLTATNPFTTANLGAELRSAGFSFAGYSQNLPAVGAQDVKVGDYARKHSPWTNWQNNGWVDDAHPPAVSLANTLPASVNQPFTSFPAGGDFSSLPTVSFVIPDLQNDMHNGTIAEADTWLQTNIDPYYQWAKTHNSLLIVTWDEDDYGTGVTNNIPTLMAGPRVKTGASVPQPYTLHNILRTVEDMYALPHAGSAARVRPIVGAFTTDPTVNRLTFQQGVVGYAGAKDTQIRQATPTTAYAATATLTVDNDDDAAAGNQAAQTLIRFDNLFDWAGGTIPADATILSAKLTLYTTNSTTTPVELHRMLSNWTTTATWNNVGGGIAADGIKAAVGSEFSLTPSLLKMTVYFDVSDTVQQWVEGSAPNYGWAILPTSTDGFDLVAAEGATVSERPLLDVSYAVYPRFSAVGGSWKTAGNWANGTPDGEGAVARFLKKPAAAVVSLDGDKTVGTLIIDSPNAYTINAGSGGGLTFINYGNVAGIQVKQGQHTLAVPLNFLDDGSVDVAEGGAITATNGITVASGKILGKVNLGVMQVSGGIALGSGARAVVAGGELSADRIVGTGALVVRSGAVARFTSGSGQASKVTGLALDGTTGAWEGTLDIGKSALVLDYTGESPLATIVDQIKSARAAGWVGAGIGSSNAYADASAAVAVVEASVLLALSDGAMAEFMGQTVDASSLIIRYTRAGDATLDGKVDFADLVKVAQNYGKTTGQGSWSAGDFNYDGKVDFSDLVTVAQNYGGAIGPDAAFSPSTDFSGDVAEAFALVPEPVGVLSVLLAPLIFRSRVRLRRDLRE